nr:hypothetical protein [Eubacterium sp.]
MMKRYFSIIPLLAISVTLICSCSKQTAERQEGVSGKAVSGASVTEMEMQSSENVIFKKSSLGDVLQRWDGANIHEYEMESEFDELLYADAEWVYYSAVHNHSSEIRRIPVVETDGIQTPRPYQIETLLTEEKFQIHDSMVVDGRYVVALIGNYRLWIFDVKQRTSKTISFDKKFGDSVKTTSQLLGYVGNTVFVYLNDYEGTMREVYSYHLKTGKRRYVKTYEEGLTMYQAAICFTAEKGEKAYYSLQEEYSPIVEKYNIKTGKRQNMIRSKKIFEQKLLVALDVSRENLMEYRITNLCLDAGRLYLQASVAWEEKGTHWGNYVFSIDDAGVEPIRYEKEITEQMKKTCQEILVEDENGKSIFVNRAVLLNVTDGKCLFDNRVELEEVEDFAYDCQMSCYDSKSGALQKYSAKEKEFYKYADAGCLIRLLDGMYMNPLDQFAQDYYGANPIWW